MRARDEARYVDSVEYSNVGIDFACDVMAGLNDVITIDVPNTKDNGVLQRP